MEKETSFAEINLKIMLIVPHPLLSLDHEVELTVIVSQKLHDVPQSTAVDYVVGYALALDMTAREIQASAKVMQIEGEREIVVSTLSLLYRSFYVEFTLFHFESLSRDWFWELCGARGCSSGYSNVRWLTFCLEILENKL
ncbi:uncharacterized protein LOC126582328 [Malus sylvestris]|uniref:uncharacterized protein LOC126582328 n=1 Tax=Malus sylvestris TaxID=3752 RepID=UPI0021AC13B1|nr:uncharacterized protein LOC126582328 [Malus sylvestris]